MFTNPVNRTAFEFKEEDGNHTVQMLLKIDCTIYQSVEMAGRQSVSMYVCPVNNREDGYAVYKIRETAFGGGTKLSAEDGFLQFMIERLLESNAPAEDRRG